MQRRDLVSDGGIGLLAATLRASDADPARVERVTGFVLVALAAVALAALGLTRRSAAGSGLAAGCLYGLGDVTSKLLFVGLPPHPGAGVVLASPWLYATPAAHGGGFVLPQRAFQQGGPVSSVAPMTAAMNLLPIAAGVAVFADPFPPTLSLAGARVLAFAAVVGGATLLRIVAPASTRATSGAGARVTRVLVADDHAAYRSRVVRTLELAGVHGYLSKDASRAAIVLAVSAAADA